MTIANVILCSYIRPQFFYNNPLLSFVQYAIGPYADDLGNVLPNAVEGVGVPVDPLAFAGLLGKFIYLFLFYVSALLLPSTFIYLFHDDNLLNKFQTDRYYIAYSLHNISLLKDLNFQIDRYI